MNSVTVMCPICWQEIIVQGVQDIADANTTALRILYPEWVVCPHCSRQIRVL